MTPAFHSSSNLSSSMVFFFLCSVLPCTFSPLLRILLLCVTPLSVFSPYSPPFRPSLVASLSLPSSSSSSSSTPPQATSQISGVSQRPSSLRSFLPRRQLESHPLVSHKDVSCLHPSRLPSEDFSSSSLLWRQSDHSHTNVEELNSSRHLLSAGFRQPGFFDTERIARRRSWIRRRRFSSFSSSALFFIGPSRLLPSPPSSFHSPSSLYPPISFSSRLFQVRWIFPIANPNPPILEAPPDLPLLQRVSLKRNSPRRKRSSPPRSDPPQGLAGDPKKAKKHVNRQDEKNKVHATSGAEDDEEGDGENEDDHEVETGDSPFVPSRLSSSSSSAYCQVSHTQKRRGMKRKKSKRINAHLKLKKKLHHTISEYSTAGGGGILKTHSLIDQGEEEMNFWRAQGERATKLKKTAKGPREEEEEEVEREGRGEEEGRKGSRDTEGDKYQHRKDQEDGEHEEERDRRGRNNERAGDVVGKTKGTSLSAHLTDSTRLLSPMGRPIVSEFSVERIRKKGCFSAFLFTCCNAEDGKHVKTSRQPSPRISPCSAFISSSSFSSPRFTPSFTCLFANRPAHPTASSVACLSDLSFLTPQRTHTRTVHTLHPPKGIYSAFSTFSELAFLSFTRSNYSGPSLQADSVSSSTFSSSLSLCFSSSSSLSSPSPDVKEERGKRGAEGEELQAVDMLDHRRLGREMEMFLLSPPSSPAGLVGPVFLPRGFQVLENLKTLIRNHQRELGFQEVN